MATFTNLMPGTRVTRVSEQFLGGYLAALMERRNGETIYLTANIASEGTRENLRTVGVEGIVQWLFDNRVVRNQVVIAVIEPNGAYLTQVYEVIEDVWQLVKYYRIAGNDVYLDALGAWDTKCG
jgi:hypothetical protein